MNGCEEIISCDAFYGGISQEFFDELKIPTMLFHYTNKYNSREVIYYEKSDEMKNSDVQKNWHEAIYQSIQKGEKNYIFFTSKQKLINLQKTLEEMGLGRDLLVYHSGKGIEDDVDVNKLWKDKKVILTTSTISVGIDFNMENVFHNIFIQCSGSSMNDAETIIQSHYRVRHLINNKVHVFINNGHMGIPCQPTSKKYIEDSFLVKEKAYIEKNQEFPQIRNDSHSVLQVPHAEVVDIFKKAPLFLQKTFINSQLSKNMSIMMLSKTIRHYFHDMGYIESNALMKERDGEEFEFIVKCVPKRMYSEIEDLTNDEYGEILRRYKSGENMAEDEKEKLDKHRFQKLIELDVIMKFPHPFIELLMDQMYTHFGNNKCTYYNIANEKCLLTSSEEDVIFDNLCHDLAKNTMGGFLEGNSLKLIHMLQIYKRLDVSMSNSKKAISRIALDDAISYTVKNSTEICSVFGIRKMETSEKDSNGTFKNKLYFLNSILSRWCFSKVKSDNKRKREKGKQIYISDYFLTDGPKGPSKIDKEIHKEMGLSVYDLIKPTNKRKTESKTVDIDHTINPLSNPDVYEE